MSLVSVNQLPRAWPLLSDWMHLSHWTDTTEIKKAKQNNNKNTKAEGWALDPPWESSQRPVSLSSSWAFSLAVAISTSWDRGSLRVMPPSETLQKPYSIHISSFLHSFSSAFHILFLLSFKLLDQKFCNIFPLNNKPELIEKWGEVPICKFLRLH